MKINISTGKKDQVLDITALVEEQLKAQDLKKGLCNIFVTHTTCAVTTADLDPGTDLDTLEALRKILPNLDFRHPHNPAHTPDHILSSIIGPSLSVPFENGKLILGTWQRIILIEFDGPRQRKLNLTFIKS